MVALITCLQDEKLIEFLLLELARSEAAGSPLDYDRVETTIQTFADGRFGNASQAGSQQVALSTEEKGKGKGKGGSSTSKTGYYSGGWSGYGHQNSQGGHGYGQWFWKRGKGSGNKGKGRGKGQGGKGRERGGCKNEDSALKRRCFRGQS